MDQQFTVAGTVLTPRTRGWLLLTAAVVALAVVGGLLLSGDGDGDGLGAVTVDATPSEQDPDAAARDGQPDDDPLHAYADEPEVAEAVADMLADMDSDADVAAELAPGTAADVAVDGALPSGAQVVPDAESWLRRGRVAAMAVRVTLPDGTADPFVVWLVDTSEGWAVSHTLRGTAP